MSEPIICQCEWCRRERRRRALLEEEAARPKGNGAKPPMWMCPYCASAPRDRYGQRSEFRASPVNPLPAKNHLVRCHGFDEGSQAVGEALVALAKLADAPGWKKVREQDAARRAKLREADQLRSQAYAVELSDRDQAVALRQKALKLLGEAG